MMITRSNTSFSFSSVSMKVLKGLFKAGGCGLTGFILYGTYKYNCGVPNRGFALLPAQDIEPVTMGNIEQRCRKIREWHQALLKKRLASTDGRKPMESKDFTQKDAFLKEMSRILELTDEQLANKVCCPDDGFQCRFEDEEGGLGEGMERRPPHNHVTVGSLVFADCRGLARYYLMFDLLEELAKRCEASLPPDATDAQRPAHEGENATAMCAVAYTLDHVISGDQVDGEVKKHVATAMDAMRSRVELAYRGPTRPGDLVVTPITDAQDTTRMIIFEDQTKISLTLTNSKGKSPTEKRGSAIILCIGTNSLDNWVLTDADIRRSALNPKHHDASMLGELSSARVVHKGFNDMFEACWGNPNFPEHLKRGDSNVTVVGHSLGGALSQLVGSALSHCGPPQRQVKVFSVASPRVFTSSAANAFEDLPNLGSMRVFNTFDFAPKAPPQFTGFEHAGTPLPVNLPLSTQNNWAQFLLQGLKLWHATTLYTECLKQDNFIQTSFIGEPVAKKMPAYT